MENNENIYCHNCGTECIADNKFCPACGAKFVKHPTCSACGKGCQDDDIFCKFCGAELEEKAISYSNKSKEESQNTNQNPEVQNNQFDFIKPYLKALVWLISVWFVISIVFALLKNFGVDLKKISEIFEEKIPNCEASEVKELAINIFKQHNLWYKDIDPDSIASIILQYPAASGYNSNIKKWNCTGQIVMSSGTEGFIPKVLDSSNKYYSYYRGESEWIPDYGYVYAKNEYHTYECSIEYSSQISEGSTLVSATNCTETNFFGNPVGGGKFEDLSINNSEVEQIKLQIQQQKEEADRIAEQQRQEEAQRQAKAEEERIKTEENERIKARNLLF